MKFGRKISVRPLTFCPFHPPLTLFRQHDLYNEWRPFYINYNQLKRELKVTHQSIRFHSFATADARLARTLPFLNMLFTGAHHLAWLDRCG